MDSRDGTVYGIWNKLRDTSARVLSPLRGCGTLGFEALKALHLADKHLALNADLSTYTLTPKYAQGFKVDGLILYERRINTFI